MLRHKNINPRGNYAEKNEEVDRMARHDHIYRGGVLAAVFISLYYCHKPVESYRVITYITAKQTNHLEDRQLDKYTHIIYGWIDLTDDGPTLSEEFGDEELKTMRQYIDDNNLKAKLMLAIGGRGFCKYTRTAVNRQLIVDFLKPLIDEYKIQGINLDWEYPGRHTRDNQPLCIHDSRDYLAMAQALRDAFGDINGFEISIAMSGSITYQNDLPMRKFAKVLDFVNVMSYDLYIPNHCSFIDVKASMFNAYLGGFPREKLNMGLALYSRSKSDKHGDEGNYMSYDTITEMIKNGEIEVKGNKNYSYALYKGYKMYFDTFEQIMRKVRHVKERGYGGVFSWYSEYNLDSSVMAAANDILNGT